MGPQAWSYVSCARADAPARVHQGLRGRYRGYAEGGSRVLAGDDHASAEPAPCTDGAAGIVDGSEGSQALEGCFRQRHRLTQRLIEQWLPIAALGAESVRERRSMTALPP